MKALLFDICAIVLQVTLDLMLMIKLANVTFLLRTLDLFKMCQQIVGHNGK